MAKKYPKIPPRVQITKKKSYEVVHIDEFKNPNVLGECRPDVCQIVIKKGQKTKQEFSTLVHEVIHALDLESGIGLTETHVLGLEKAILNFLLLNKLI